MRRFPTLKAAAFACIFNIAFCGRGRRRGRGRGRKRATSKDSYVIYFNFSQHVVNEEGAAEGVGAAGAGGRRGSTVMGANLDGGRHKLHARECEDVSVKQLSA